MGLTVIVALLLLSLQHVEVDSSQPVPSDHALKTNIAENSHHHQRRSSVWGLIKKTFKLQKKVRPDDYSKLEKLTSFNPENGVFFTDGKNRELYIAMDKQCKPCAYDNDAKKCIDNSVTADQYLVNVDHFEILEWQPVINSKIPPLAVEICDGKVITKNNNNLNFVKRWKYWFYSKKDENVTVLTQKKFKEEFLTNITFDSESGQKTKRPAMLNHLTVLNNNCNEMKQQVKIDSGFEETESFQIGKSILFGASLGLKIKEFGADVKADFGGSESETKSNIKKNAYSYSQDIVIPAASSCKIEIRSEATVSIVPFKADITRVYEDDDTSTTSISGKYTYLELTEIKTDFISCTKLNNVHCPPPK